MVLYFYRTINNAPIHQTKADLEESSLTPNNENDSTNISQPSCSTSILPHNTTPHDNTSTFQNYNFHSTTAPNDSTNKNYEKIHLNTDELSFDDDIPSTQFSQTTFNSDIASTQ